LRGKKETTPSGLQVVYILPQWGAKPIEQIFTQIGNSSRIYDIMALYKLDYYCCYLILLSLMILSNFVLNNFRVFRSMWVQISIFS